MPRYKLIIEYDGAPFVGWQVQDNGPSVQGAIDGGDRGVQRRDGRGAGRRPHRRRRACARPGRAFRSRAATASPTRCATRSTRICGRIRSRCLSAEQVAGDFDARRSAVRRHYLYRIVNRRPDLALERGRAWRVPRPLDAEAMHAAAQRLVGQHDFTTFRSTECQAKSPEKTLDRLDVSRAGDEIAITRRRRARSCTTRCARWSARWCWSGEGKWSADDLARALAARDRAACGPVAPPDGLYLVRVDY